MKGCLDFDISNPDALVSSCFDALVNDHILLAQFF